ncbi:hypothetical protein JOB18_009182 [Solea senegalensis]|uniref:Uncharacterized protein n=1 Tax=Solea senegalensis TaxID=28829 RepID=A0AAV6QDE9_SOLSE|nr:hypothetical protein JOB18_009182 [Solea senegalensis]
MILTLWTKYEFCLKKKINNDIVFLRGVFRQAEVVWTAEVLRRVSGVKRFVLNDFNVIYLDPALRVIPLGASCHSHCRLTGHDGRSCSLQHAA